MTITSLILAAATPAAGHVDPAQLDRAVAEFTGSALGSDGGAARRVDPRLRLRNCVQPLALSWRDARQTTVVMRCPDTGGWQIFVPVLREATPATAKVAVPEEQSSPVLVRRGDAVAISLAGRGFTISRTGEALEAGSLGEWIKVRPVSDKRRAEKPVLARVTRGGQVEVIAP